jgi:NAD(P)H-hydrate epimerase
MLLFGRKLPAWRLGVVLEQYRTADGISVLAVTAEQMREIDRIAMDDFGLGILQMMENAGRNLAGHAVAMVPSSDSEIVILAGGGGNGGGGLCCARHLHNRGYRVRIVLDRLPSELRGSAAAQWRILSRAGLGEVDDRVLPGVMSDADLVIDALIGYSLRGAPKGRAAQLIQLCNDCGRRILALDVPSGLDATTGEAPGDVVRADRVLTLALPKTGLKAVPGELYLADLGIPPEVYRRLDLTYTQPFGTAYWVQLVGQSPGVSVGTKGC